uniref:Uncharacterized protein n=1 Tax=Parascaris univalens TaxID=6257 RepID=A0A915B2N3_PARUN
MASIARLTASDSISSSIPDATRTTLGSAFLFVFVDSWRRSSHGILDSSAATSIMEYRNHSRCAMKRRVTRGNQKLLTDRGRGRNSL